MDASTKSVTWIYEGERKTSGCPVFVRREHGREDDERLPDRRDLFNHSRGFEWGYGGSGPAQLALALAADATGVKGQEHLRG